MIATAQAATETLVLRHHYEANPDQVFQAWSDPKALGEWFGPHSHKCKVEKYDFCDNGDYQIRMIPVGEDADCAGDTAEDSVCAGKFVQIVPGEKIVMTFNWIEYGADMGDTLLTIEMSAKGGGTDLVLTHERLPNEELYEAHKGGWEGTLECIETFLSA
ncbi:MAG: SRPBCC domain-containing protein [Gammaproteobacteria bacterium]